MSVLKVGAVPGGNVLKRLGGAARLRCLTASVSCAAMAAAVEYARLRSLLYIASKRCPASPKAAAAAF